jgi:hypothetical protein
VFFAVQMQAVRIGESPRHPMGNSSLVVVTDISASEGYGLPQSQDTDARDRSTWSKLPAWLVNHLEADRKALEDTFQGQ